MESDACDEGGEEGGLSERSQLWVLERWRERWGERKEKGKNIVCASGAGEVRDIR